eukprot:1339668-Heterocapsa_arctica.AAC.1
MAAELTQAQEEAAAAEAKKTRESVGKSHTPAPERVNRRALRSPSRDKDGTAAEAEAAPALEPVPEEGANRKVPSDAEEEEEVEEGAPEEAQPEPEEVQEDKDI